MRVRPISMYKTSTWDPAKCTLENVTTPWSATHASATHAVVIAIA